MRAEYLRSDHIKLYYVTTVSGVPAAVEFLFVYVQVVVEVAFFQAHVLHHVMKTPPGKEK